MKEKNVCMKEFCSIFSKLSILCPSRVIEKFRVNWGSSLFEMLTSIKGSSYNNSFLTFEQSKLISWSPSFSNSFAIVFFWQSKIRFSLEIFPARILHALWFIIMTIILLLSQPSDGIRFWSLTLMRFFPFRNNAHL